jgi:Cu+-exporting ATPase
MNTVYVARCFALAAFLSSLAVLTPLAAAKSPKDATVVTVKKLCPTCGKKIAQKLEQIPQVASASINVEQRLVQVAAMPGQVLSPRLIWELVEKGGEQPVKLQGPSGTLTTKPQQ